MEQVPPNLIHNKTFSTPTSKNPSACLPTHNSRLSPIFSPYFTREKVKPYDIIILNEEANSEHRFYKSSRAYLKVELHRPHKEDQILQTYHCPAHLWSITRKKCSLRLCTLPQAGRSLHGHLLLWPQGHEDQGLEREDHACTFLCRCLP